MEHTYKLHIQTSCTHKFVSIHTPHSPLYIRPNLSLTNIPFPLTHFNHSILFTHHIRNLPFPHSKPPLSLPLWAPAKRRCPWTFSGRRTGWDEDPSQSHRVFACHWIILLLLFNSISILNFFFGLSPSAKQILSVNVNFNDDFLFRVPILSGCQVVRFDYLLHQWPWNP